MTKKIEEKIYFIYFPLTSRSREIEGVGRNGELDYNRGIIPADDTLCLISRIIANGVLLCRKGG